MYAMTRDVIGIYHTLEQHFGPEAVHLSAAYSTASIRMIANDGTPLLSGWFQNEGTRVRQRDARNGYALTAVPTDAKTIHHRLLIAQLADTADEASVKEEDSQGYLGGHDASPIVVSYSDIGQPALTGLIEILLTGALVLDNDQANGYMKIARSLPIAAVREHGQALRAQGSGLGYIAF